MITPDERTRQFIALTVRMTQLQADKGRDYDGGEDGLRNLRRRGVQGVVARIGDKLSRLESLTQPGREASVKEESLDDTLIDMANYCLLLIILRNDLAGGSASNSKESSAKPHGSATDALGKAELARQAGLRTVAKPGDPDFKESV